MTDGDGRTETDGRRRTEVRPRARVQLWLALFGSSGYVEKYAAGTRASTTSAWLYLLLLLLLDVSRRQLVSWSIDSSPDHVKQHIGPAVAEFACKQDTSDACLIMASAIAQQHGPLARARAAVRTCGKAEWTVPRRSVVAIGCGLDNGQIDAACRSHLTPTLLRAAFLPPRST